jgi:predicted O-linked N-acetylglucosamine transferase (SPINDLY family)
MDYFIGDRVTITDENREFFTEKIVYMPNQFQVNPISREISHREISRSSYGLPSDFFVYCCFNSNWKITPRMFDLWMKILKEVPRSVLWLLSENACSAKNLLHVANANAIKSDRIIFTSKIPEHSEHLARYSLADLFLDTAPYNAHTTGSDALWCGLPVLTMAGKSFTSRVSASLLSSFGLDELVTYDSEDYVAAAVKYGNDPNNLNKLKEKILADRSTTPLFDTKRFSRNLERAYEIMYERHHSGATLRHIDVDS